MVLYGGIDPGATGGIGIVDQDGQFIAAHRWDKKDPAKLYNILNIIKGEVSIIYLEMINAHPGQGVGHVTRNQALVENYGVWKGFLIAAGISFLIIHPSTWQSFHGLRSWQTIKDGPSPLTLARSKWPGAPLVHKVDDGKGVGLLLAAMAAQEARAGIDRAAIQAQAAAKKTQAKIRKKAKNALNPKNQPHQNHQDAR